MPKPTFFARNALLILLVIFFCAPFAVRGARLGLQGMKNDIKNWLPSEFEETKDLNEFREHFLSEQFVLLSWAGCYGDATDERFRMFVAKLTPEVPPSQQAKPTDAATRGLRDDATSPQSERFREADASRLPAENPHPARNLHRDADFIGDRLGLYYAGDWYHDWGGQREKWLKGLRLTQDDSNVECWYYLTPDGDLYRWDGVDQPVAALARNIRRKVVGKQLQGELVHSFGAIDGAWYHADPRRLRAQLFKTVTTGPDVLASLTCEGGELAGDEAEAHRRLSGNLFGPDGKTTCIMLTLTDAAKRNLHLVLGRGMLGKPRGRLLEIAEESNIAYEELRMGGPPVDNVAIDEEGAITMARLIGYSVAMGVILSLLCFRSISATLMVLIVGGLSAIMSVAFVWASGSTMDAILMSMPSLVYVLGLSGAAHVMNYYKEAVEEHGHHGACERAVAHGWKPALLCELTTAIGLISLVTSELVPIRKFGIFAALGVMAMLVVMLLYLPSALQLWPQTYKKRTAREQSWLDSFLGNFWARFSGWIVNHHGLVTVACFLIIGFLSYGLVRMKTSVNLLHMFSSEAKIIRDYEWLEANLGRLMPMEVVVRVPKDAQCPSNDELRNLQDELASDQTTAERRGQIEQRLAAAQFQMPFLERMELAARVQNVIEEEFGAEGRDVVGRAISAATFVRPLPKPGGGTLARSLRTSTSGRLEAHVDDFLHSDYLRIDDTTQTEMWRVSLRLAATKGVDYGAFVSKLQETIEPVIAAQHEREAILRTLADRAAQAGEKPTLAGRRVLLLGVPATALAAANPVQEVAKSPPTDAAAAAKHEDDPLAGFTPINQDRIFIRTLRDLLINARLATTLHSPAGELPANFDQVVAAQDCVVLVGDVSAYNLTALKQQARLVVDARDHAFIPGSQRTAWQREPDRMAAVYTGVVPIVYKAQRMLLESLIQSTFWSILTITPLLMWIARSFWAGLVSMIPNVLPVAMVFGGMGWLGIDVDVGSMMTASIALGVAVDDTIHFLNWFREELDRLGDRKQAILATYRHCATPTLQAATISGLGLSVFAVSSFTPTQRFGVLMLVVLWLGAIAELIFFPALLAGPLGSVFVPRKKNQSPPTPPTDECGPPLLVVVRDEDDEDDALAAVATIDPAAPGVPPPHTGATRPATSAGPRPKRPHAAL